MPALKICMITPQYGHLWTGVGTYTTHLVNGLADRGHEVTVLCPGASERNVHPGVRIVNADGLKIRPTLGNWFFLSYYFNKTLQDLIQREFPDVVHFDVVHFADARDSLFCKIKKIPVVGTMHDYYFAEASKNPLTYRRYYKDWPGRWLFYNLTRALEKRAIGKLAFVIANSNYVRESIIRSYGIKENLVKTVYIGLKKVEIASDKKEVERLKGHPAILFVGQNFRRKGLPVLIHAVGDVQKRFPEISLHVVGRVSKEKEDEMRDLSRSLGVGAHVHFLGWRDHEEARRLFSKADIFAMPSLLEGFGLVFLEAMNAGIPVIGGDTGGTPELIRNGVNGFLVRPGDWQDLSKKIQLLAEDKGQREKLIGNGYETVEIFSINRMVEETINVYLTLKKEGQRA